MPSFTNLNPQATIWVPRCTMTQKSPLTELESKAAIVTYMLYIQLYVQRSLFNDYDGLNIFAERYDVQSPINEKEVRQLIDVYILDNNFIGNLALAYEKGYITRLFEKVLNFQGPNESCGILGFYVERLE
ncbi:MAG: hypothetical protein CBB84_000150 [Phycisphaera sp. TMED24]|nr:MAG: hypothetical protein CBB84_000150 [Phycisphaera sp. TMED24]|tara:strand:- start:365 stop:754 length:390 start_codon:yes stop_codon:yes gene_type:complete